MNYFLWIDGAQAGPYTWAQIKAMFAEKSISPETPFWQEGMAGWQPLSTIFDPASSGPTGAPKPVVDLNPRLFGGFFRRLGAMVVDSIVLGLIGSLLGLAFFDALSTLGAVGPLLGLVIATCYFGFQNSALCGGQTLGKRIVGIQVVDVEGKSISPGRSIARYLAFGLPFFMGNPMLLGSSLASLPGLLLCGLVSFWLGTIAYLFVFNLPTRQSLHDLLVHTYVVRTKTRGAVTPSKLWLGHYAVLGLLGSLMLAMVCAGYLLIQWGPFPQLLAIQRTLQADPHVGYASVSAGKNYSFGNAAPRESSSLEVTVFWNGKPDNMDDAVRSVADTLISKAHDEVSKQDLVDIQVSYGYNIGIASSSVSSSYSHSPEEWEKIVSDSSAP